ncbi:hypothetical protein HYPSUDRAFT_208232 [Hypholoma sublateritium FD-334 SS-4]|uniref:Uncharacterized protein n=1 Tax=Hypholoma sublateritium (strain FD-334 SS-4) TaxID=945553 RepID=A0A0D2N789_HYPSF|nr:hypothetical protein HYPSUDRAFT_208232 [Hypholoma sublateritium FD-334 SS-4]
MFTVNEAIRFVAGLPIGSAQHIHKLNCGDIRCTDSDAFPPSDLPLDALGPEQCANLERSLAMSPSDGPARAASARLWESLLEAHRLPFLLLRVADMRMSLGSKVTVMALYEELSGVLDDSDFGEWATRSRAEILAGAYRRLLLQRAQIAAMRAQWTSMGAAADVVARFLNLHCLETSVMEGAFQFDEKATSELVKSGFDPMPPLTSKQIVGGEVRNISDAASMLRDTHKISYINTGTTRQVSQINVTAATATTGRRTKVQFCPYDEIDSELRTFCERFNELIRQADRDPFASAAWISRVLGRKRAPIPNSSVDSSAAQRPPPSLHPCVLQIGIRADRNGDYQMATEMLYNETTKSMNLLGERHMQ